MNDYWLHRLKLVAHRVRLNSFEVEVAVIGMKKCQHGLPYEFCGRCQIIPRNSRHFSTKVTSDDRGKRIIEILKNGGPITHYDQHFRFYAETASLILACMEAIKHLGDCDDSDVTEYCEKRYERPGYGEGIVDCRKEFETQYGKSVELPYLRLKRHGGFPEKGMGREKCKALVATEEDLIRFVQDEPQNLAMFSDV